MTISLNSVAAFCAIVAVLFATAAFLPLDSHAVVNPPKCVFNTIVQPQHNGGTTLSWRVYDAQTVHLSGIGDVDDADALVVFPDEVTTYTITATGRGGTTTCSAVAHPVSSYPSLINAGPFGFANVPINTNQVCAMRVSPDFVVPGGTAVLSWTAPGASSVFLNNGIGNVGRTGSRIVPASATSMTYTLTAEYPGGAVRNCSATVHPATGSVGAQAPGAFVLQTPGVTLPNQVAAPVVQVPAPTVPQATIPTTAAHAVPNVIVTPTAVPAPVTHVSLNQVPYTGPEDALYVFAMLFASISIGAFLFRSREIVLG